MAGGGSLGFSEGVDAGGFDSSGGFDVDCDGVPDAGGFVGLLPVPSVLFADELLTGALLFVSVDMVWVASCVEASVEFSVSLVMISELSVTVTEVSADSPSCGVVFFTPSNGFSPQAASERIKHSNNSTDNVFFI